MARFVVAVTGGVASGKSAVSEMFERLGVVVVDADVVARSVVGHGQPALTEIAERFGREVILPDGSLDRVRMRALVFENLQSRRDLESITHPRIRALLRSECLAAPGPYAIAAIPLLAESTSIVAYSWVNRVLVVDTPVALQLSRLISRDGIDTALAARMIHAQASRHQRLALATDVVVNDGVIQDLQTPVAKLNSMYARLAASN